MSKKLKLNVISSTSVYLINVVIAFFMSPILIRALGNRDYGLWDVVLGIIGYMGLLDLGMGPALVRYVSVAEANNNEQMLKKYVSSAFFFFLLVGIIAFCVLILIGFNPTWILGSQAKEVSSLKLVFIIVGVNLFVQFPGTVLVGTLMGLQRHYFINFVRSILAVAQAILIVVLIKAYPAYCLVILASVETFGLLFQYSLYALMFVTIQQLPTPSVRTFSWLAVREMWWFGIRNSMLMLASRLQKQAVPFIIGRSIGLQTVVFFSLPNRLVEYGRGLSMAMGFPLMPYFGALSQSEDVADIQQNWKKTSFALQTVTLVMPILLWFAGEPFLNLWIGETYAKNGGLVLKILIVGLAFEALSPNAGRYLVGAAKHGQAAKIWLIISIVFVPCAILGANIAGIVGVALASSLASSCGACVTLYLACRQLDLTVKVHLNDTVMPLMLPLFLSALSLWAVFKVWPPLSYASLIFGTTLSLCLYFVLVLFKINNFKFIPSVKRSSQI